MRFVIVGESTNLYSLLGKPSIPTETSHSDAALYSTSFFILRNVLEKLLMDKIEIKTLNGQKRLHLNQNFNYFLLLLKHYRINVIA